MKGCRPLNHKEVVMMLASFTGTFAKRDKALFTLGIKSGFRISELLSLQLKDVWTGSKVSQYVTVSRNNMKKKTEGRTIPLNRIAQKAIRELIITVDNRDGDTYLFKSRNGHNKPITRQQADRVLNKYFSLLGFTGKLGTHSMRKTFANNIHEALGFDLVKTQHAMGHKAIESTIKYLQPDHESIELAIMEL